MSQDQRRSRRRGIRYACPSGCKAAKWSFAECRGIFNCSTVLRSRRRMPSSPAWRCRAWSCGRRPSRQASRTVGGPRSSSATSNSLQQNTSSTSTSIWKCSRTPSITPSALLIAAMVEVEVDATPSSASQTASQHSFRTEIPRGKLDAAKQ